jgi:hypothetical protein
VFVVPLTNWILQCQLPLCSLKYSLSYQSVGGRYHVSLCGLGLSVFRLFCFSSLGLNQICYNLGNFDVFMVLLSNWVLQRQLQICCLKYSQLYQSVGGALFHAMV